MNSFTLSLSLKGQKHRVSLPCGLVLLISVSRDVSSLQFSCALINRDPSWFNETWLGRIKEESGANWRLKVICETAWYDRTPCSYLEWLKSKIFFLNSSAWLMKVLRLQHCFILSGQQLEKDSEKHDGILSRCKKLLLICTFIFHALLDSSLTSHFSVPWTGARSPGVWWAYARREPDRRDGRCHRTGKAGTARVGLCSQLREETR